MPKSKLLILDANIVIHLFEAGLWHSILAKWEVHLSSVVAFQEAIFYLDCQEQIPIELTADINGKRLRIFDMPVSSLLAFQKQFDRNYLERLDPGEAESLAFLVESREEFLISSADAIVFKVLGNLNLSHQGISLEQFALAVGNAQGRNHPPMTDVHLLVSKIIN